MEGAESAEGSEGAEGAEGVEGVVDAEGAPLRVAHPSEHGERVLLEELLIARWPEGVEQPSAPGVGAARARLDGPLVRLVGAVDDGRCGELAQLHLAAEVRDGDGMQQREAVADLLGVGVRVGVRVGLRVSVRVLLGLEKRWQTAAR